MSPADETRTFRLQIMIDNQELEAIDKWRFDKRMPSRAAAIRELMRRGLISVGFNLANRGEGSGGYGVIDTPPPDKWSDDPIKKK